VENAWKAKENAQHLHLTIADMWNNIMNCRQKAKLITGKVLRNRKIKLWQNCNGVTVTKTN